jgi:hypothetical protein
MQLEVVADAPPVVDAPERDRDALMTREQVAHALTVAGYPVAKTTLACMAVRGGGPAYHLFGNKPLYRWGVALDWAVARMRPARRTTSEHNPPAAA